MMWCHLEIDLTGALFLWLKSCTLFARDQIGFSFFFLFFFRLCMLNKGAHWGLRASVRVCVHTCFLEEICNSLSPWRAHMTWMKLNWQPFSPKAPEVHAGRLAILLTLPGADLPQGQSSLTKLPYIDNSFSLYCTFIWHHMILNSVLFKSCSVKEGRKPLLVWVLGFFVSVFKNNSKQCWIQMWIFSMNHKSNLCVKLTL